MNPVNISIQALTLDLAGNSILGTHETSLSIPPQKGDRLRFIYKDPDTHQLQELAFTIAYIEHCFRLKRAGEHASRYVYDLRLICESPGAPVSPEQLTHTQKIWTAAGFRVTVS